MSSKETPEDNHSGTTAALAPDATIFVPVGRHTTGSFHTRPDCSQLQKASEVTQKRYDQRPLSATECEYCRSARRGEVSA